MRPDFLLYFTVLIERSQRSTHWNLLCNRVTFVKSRALSFVQDVVLFLKLL